MKIKEQAAAALELDPFTKTFVCETKCTKPGCDSFVRRTSGCFICHECSKKGSAARRRMKPEQAALDNKTWYAKNKDYVSAMNRAKYLRRKEIEAV